MKGDEVALVGHPSSGHDPNVPPEHTFATLTTLRRDAVELPLLELVITPPGGAPPMTAALGLSPLALGTSADCDVVLADSRISRRHCSVQLDERGVIVRDLGSKNGTFVRGVRVYEAELEASSVVEIGGTRIVVRAIGSTTEVALSPAARFGACLGGTVVMRALFARLEKAAATSESVLLLGESGTGKELLARAVHDASPRRDHPFAIFDCGAVAPNLIESELFGYVKGAFTGANEDRAGLLEQAGEGTLFIDEIGELPLALQPKLLRALEAHEYRPVGSSAWRPFRGRIVAATHRDLKARVGDGTFRADLYFRLAVLEARVPPLRERRDDIELLVEHFLAHQVPPKTVLDLPPNALTMLKAHEWPGNARELRNTVARLVLFPHLGSEIFDGPEGSTRSGASLGSLDELTKLPLREAREQVVERFEREYLAAKLAEFDGSVQRAAESMGVSRQFVHRLVERYGLKRPRG